MYAQTHTHTYTQYTNAPTQCIHQMNVKMFTIIHNYYRGDSQTREKPKVVEDYNQYMLGVDKTDQLASYYNFLHKSVKWWRKVFFWCVEVTVINSYIIHKEQAQRRGERVKTHLAYRRHLIEFLSEPVRCNVVPRPRRLGRRSGQHLERLQPVPHFLQKDDLRRDCTVCSSRVRGATRHLTMYTCSTCTNHPYLCPSPCFKTYHTKKNYHT